jgi:hypothetical protein
MGVKYSLLPLGQNIDESNILDFHDGDDDDDVLLGFGAE